MEFKDNGKMVSAKSKVFAVGYNQILLSGGGSDYELENIRLVMDANLELYCCKDMMDRFQDINNIIRLAGGRTRRLNKSRFDHKVPFLGIRDTECEEDCCSGVHESTEYIPIDYCPWCGAKIKLNQVKLFKENLEEIERTEVIKTHRVNRVEVV